MTVDLPPVLGEQPADEARAPVVSDRALVLLALVSAVVLAVTVAVCLWFWHTPAPHPVDVPTVASA